MQPFIRHLASRTSFFRPPANIFTPRSFTMSASNSNQSPLQHSSIQTTPAPEEAADLHKETLALPEIPHNASGTTTLDMSNGDASIKLDHLGPMVVNVDGTMSRISNWDKLAEIEKKNTLRIIGKRNQVRLEALRAKEAQKGENGKF
jgi:hypothetical protein